MAGVTVEEVSGRAAHRRFLELPFALFRDEPRWAPPVLAFERWRLDPHRNPFFDDGDAAYFLARRLGRPVGRIAAHVEHRHDPGEEGHFGFFDVADDPDAAPALLDAARRWLAERGCTTMAGPLSFTAEVEAGVLADGFDVAGVTGRPWHPPWYAAALAASGLEPSGDRPSWRLPAVAGPRGMATADGGELPPHAGSYGDRGLVVGGAGGAIAAVPDLAGALRSAGVRGAWRLAGRARRHDWEGCTVVRVVGDPALLVPTLQAAAAQRGYRWVIAPWAPDGRPPEAVHRLWSGRIASAGVDATPAA